MIVGIVSSALSLRYLEYLSIVSEQLIMSSKKKKLKEEDERREQYNQAAEAFRQGLFPSVTACAGHFGVNHKTLMNCIKSEREFVGCGRKSSTFTTEEESRLVKFAKAVALTSVNSALSSRSWLTLSKLPILSESSQVPGSPITLMSLLLEDSLTGTTWR